MRCRLIPFLLALSIAIATRYTDAAPPTTRPVDRDRIVVMISIDGLAAFYFDDPKAEMPTLHQLADNGAHAGGMRAVAPTVTWPNHTTLVTGDQPARHGVIGNNYFDREKGKDVPLIFDPLYDKDQIVKVPTLYDLAKASGLSTAAVRWPGTRNARTLDWAVPDVVSSTLLHQYTTPALLSECQQMGIWSDGQVLDPAVPDKRTMVDETSIKIFQTILHAHRPQLALLHLINIDHVQHLSGPRSPEAYAAIKMADAQIREIWNQLQSEYPGKATLLIVSDHGFAQIDHTILPNTLLRDAGLVEVVGVRVVKGAVRVITQGGAAMLYVTDRANHDQVLQAAVKIFQSVRGVERVVTTADFAKYGLPDPKDDPHAPDLLLFADEGYSFGDTAAGSLGVNDKPERRGTHGHNPDLPDLKATFIAWGAGIIPQSRVAQMEIRDVAPTVAALLGIPMLNVDGRAWQGCLAQD